MGYESRLYVVQKGHVFGKETMRYCHEIAKFEMCKFPFLANFMTAAKEADCYVYSDDGDTKIVEDRYGKPLTEAPVSDVVTVLERALNNGEDYRRIKPVLMFLKAILYQIEHGIWNDVVVLHYGY